MSILESERKKKVDRLIEKVKSLPSLPSLYLELVRELRSPMVSVRRVGQIISKDLGMTPKLLQLVNSAYFGISREVTSVERAVALLGLNLVRDCVLVTHIFSQLDPSRPEMSSVAGLWRHSMSCAGLARQVARNEGADNGLVELAATAGLLHDVGKLILATHLGERYQSLYELARQEQIELYLVEEQYLGFNHAEVGASLLERWGLPRELVAAVGFHHQPGLLAEKGFSALTAVHVANYFDHALESYAADSLQVDRSYLSSLELGDRMSEWFQTAGSMRDQHLARTS